MRYLNIPVTTESGDSAFTLRFEYIRDTRRLYFLNADRLPNLFIMNGSVRCDVLDSAGHVICSGSSWCFRKDRFYKKTGERVALSRAFKDILCELDKPTRSHIWRAYLEARPIPPTRRSGTNAPRSHRKATLDAVMDKLIPKGN